MTLQDALRELAEARKQRELAKRHAEELSDRLLEMDEYQESVAAEKRAFDLWGAAKASEAKVRELALAEHALSRDPKPAEGVQVKLFSKVVYEPAQALGWCLAHATKYLVLDVKAFEKAAPVLRDLGAPVALTKEPRAQIATDLSVWLANEGESEADLPTAAGAPF